MLPQTFPVIVWQFKMAKRDRASRDFPSLYSLALRLWEPIIRKLTSRSKISRPESKIVNSSKSDLHKPSGPTFQIYRHIAGFGAVLFLFFLLVGMWRTGNRLKAGIAAFFNAPPATPQVEVTALILSQIRAVSELTTAVFVMESVVPTSQERKVGNFTLGKTRLLYIARGEVRAGIDLSQLSPEQIAIGDRSIRLQLPPPKILDSKIDVGQSRVYDYDRGFLGLGPDVAPQLQSLAQRATLHKILAHACQAGILKEASDRADLAITQVLSTAGYQSIEVIPAPNPTCEAPAGATASNDRRVLEPGVTSLGEVPRRGDDFQENGAS